MNDKNTVPDLEQKSPLWGNNIKLVIVLFLFAIAAWVFLRFQHIMGPLLLAVVIPYLLHPLADGLRKKLKLSWRMTVNLLYLVFIIVLIGLLTWGGIALVDQIGSLLNFLQRSLTNSPDFLNSLLSQPFAIGPLNIDLSGLSVINFREQLLGLLQPILANTGTLLGSLAGGAATTIGWLFFILLVSYFILVESKGVGKRFINFQIPGHSYDVRRMGQELGKIWNSFLRGQLIVVFITIVIYIILLGVLGVRFFYVLALIAGVARFVPYVGAWVTWISYGLVALFQETNIFGLENIYFVILVLAISILVDTLIDNLINTRIMANTLKVHPAAVMFAVILGASLFGFIGVLLAAPVLASLQLFFTYIVKKLLDADPWEGMSTSTRTPSLARLFPWTKKILLKIKELGKKIRFKRDIKK